MYSYSYSPAPTPLRPLLRSRVQNEPKTAQRPAALRDVNLSAVRRTPINPYSTCAPQRCAHEKTRGFPWAARRSEFCPALRPIFFPAFSAFRIRLVRSAMVSGTRMLGAATVELGGPTDILAPNGRAPKMRGRGGTRPARGGEGAAARLAGMPVQACVWVGKFPTDTMILKRKCKCLNSIIMQVKGFKLERLRRPLAPRGADATEAEPPTRAAPPAATWG